MQAELSAAEKSYYQRHIALPEVGEQGQQRLKQARILCVGAGGLGTPALQYLAAAGVGTLGIIDDDVVEVSNLSRQILYAYADVGRPKVRVARDRLLACNPFISVETHAVRLTRDNALAISAAYDMVIDASDNFYTRYLINDACVTQNKPFVSASLARFAAQCTVFAAPHGACYRCLYPAPPLSMPFGNCTQAGVLGVLPGSMGVMQATEVLKWILGIGQLLQNRLVLFDALAMEWRQLQVTRDAACCACAKRHAFADLPRYEYLLQEDNMCAQPVISVQELQALRQQQADFMLLDVREPQEYAEYHLGGYLIPLGQLADRLAELPKDKHLVVHCKLGGRSQRACELLRAAGFTQVQNLTGGIMAWIAEIDPALPLRGSD